MWSLLNTGGTTMERFLILFFTLTSLTLHAASNEDFNPSLQPITMVPYPLEELNNNEPLETDISEQTTHKKSISELVNEQTEAIKRIISAHKSPDPEYPIVTKQKADVKHKIPPPAPLGEITEQETIETLKIKCEHLAKLNNMKIQLKQDEEDVATTVSQSLTTGLSSSTAVTSTISAYPYYITPKPLVYDYQGQKKHPQGFYIVNNNNLSTKDRLTASASNQVSQQKQYFYSTAPTTTTTSTTTIMPTLSAQASAINQNYIKMEPVVLQRTMLTNGNMLFYWYRPLRNMQNPEMSGYNYQNHQENVLSGQGTQYGVGQYGGYPLYPLRRKEELPSTTTSTTTERSPQIEVDYGSQEPDNNLYRSQYRFVLPMAYKAPLTDNIESASGQFDQYAYLPDHLRPTLMNVQMPYMPTYHVIKAISVPKQDGHDSGMYGGRLEDGSDVVNRYNQGGV